MVQTLSPPSRSDVKTMSLPSGLNRGCASNAMPLVSCVASPPAIGTVYKSPSRSNTTVRPSGDTSTDIQDPSSVSIEMVRAGSSGRSRPRAAGCAAATVRAESCAPRGEMAASVAANASDEPMTRTSITTSMEPWASIMIRHARFREFSSYETQTELLNCSGTPFLYLTIKPPRHERSDLSHHEIVELLDLVAGDVRNLMWIPDTRVVSEKHVFATRASRHRAEQEFRRPVHAARGHRIDRHPARARIRNRLVIRVVGAAVLLWRRVGEQKEHLRDRVARPRLTHHCLEPRVHVLGEIAAATGTRGCNERDGGINVARERQ